MGFTHQRPVVGALQCQLLISGTDKLRQIFWASLLEISV